MPLTRILLLLSMGLALTACAGLTKSAKPFLADAPISLRKECEGPAKLPPGRMTQAGVEKNWTRDRAALAKCKSRHKAVVDFYVNRDRALR